MFTKTVCKEFLKQCLTALLILLLGIIVGYLLLALVYLIPIGPSYRKLQDARNDLNYLHEVIPGWTGSQLDNYMDSAMLAQAVCDTDAPMLEKIINNYQVNYWQEYTHEKNLEEYLLGTEGYSYQGYTHYWGGHLVYLKPLLALFSLKNIRYLGILLQAVLFTMIIYGLSRNPGTSYGVLPFCIAVVSASPVTMALSFQLCDIYYIALATSLVILFGYRKIGAERMYLVFLLSGMCVSYFDFLTYPFFALGIPLCILLICMREYDPVPLRSILLRIVRYSFFWCVGYAGFWVGKWVSASILMPSSGSLQMAINSLLYRGGKQAGDVSLNLITVVSENLRVYVTIPLILVCVIFIAVCLVRILCYHTLSKEKVSFSIAFFVVCLYPLIWYRLAENHSYEHSYMQYRELAIATCAGLMLFAFLADRSEQKKDV